MDKDGLRIYLQSFCETHGEYTFTGEGNQTGIALSEDMSYMDMLHKLTDFLDEHGFDDADSELEGVYAVERDGLQVVCFPMINSYE